jgi:hypothetical protein
LIPTVSEKEVCMAVEDLISFSGFLGSSKREKREVLLNS